MDAALLAAIILGALAVIGAAVGIVVWAQATPRRSTGAESAPPPVYLPGADLGAAVPVRPATMAAPAVAVAPAPAPPSAEQQLPPLALAVGAERDRGWHADNAGAGLRARRRPPIGRPVLEPVEPSPEAAAAASAAASLLTGTLRMLPGRLEVVSGLAQRAEIRFVQTASAGDQRVTLGRAPGAPYEHVTLPSQTVSREHAAMTFTRDGWTITNLSTTNPLRVNGTPVGVEGAAVLLSDGDVVELGEVVLRYRI